MIEIEEEKKNFSFHDNNSNKKNIDHHYKFA